MQLTVVRNLAVAALLVGLLIGGAVGWAASGDDTSNAAATPAPIVGGAAKAAKPAAGGKEGGHTTTETTASAADLARTRANEIAGALAKGVRNAVRRYPGSIEAAVWASDWRGPIVRAVRPGETRVRTSSDRRLLLWSMSKAVTAIALLQTEGGTPPPAVREALRGALTRSENCRQRRVVLELQRLMDGAKGAATAVSDVLRDAGADPSGISPRAAPPDDATCVARLGTELGWTDSPSASALQLGIDDWTITDAVSFAHHLADGGYGAAGEEVRALLSLPKRKSREVGPENFTAALDWGAGAAFKGVATPAYKAGWGGRASRPKRPYVAGQVIAVTVHGERYGIAVYYHPDKQPDNDDPGFSEAPDALAAILGPLVRKLAAGG